MLLTEDQEIIGLALKHLQELVKDRSRRSSEALIKNGLELLQHRDDESSDLSLLWSNHKAVAQLLANEIARTCHNANLKDIIFQFNRELNLTSGHKK